MDVTELQQHTLKYHSYDELLSALNGNNNQANHYVILNESKDETGFYRHNLVAFTILVEVKIFSLFVASCH